MNKLSSLNCELLEPADCRRIVPNISGSIWVYRYVHRSKGWTLSIATNAEPNSMKLSLGGFRIVPEQRSKINGYSNDREAIELAQGMEEKVFWSRLVKIGGPLGLKNLDRIVGGKCVLLPTSDARVGRNKDFELLDFALECLNDFEEIAGIKITTGQDMGHGTMSDLKTSSLQYMTERFHGSVISDTSKPTGEGNFFFLRGALKALGIELKNARIGLVGCGNVGSQVLSRLKESGSDVIALERSESRLKEIEALGCKGVSYEKKTDFLADEMDALVINAAGSTLDAESIALVKENNTIKVICGSENLAMPDPSGVDTLLKAKKIYGPTELCGMMGYLTAVEEYLSKQKSKVFSSDIMHKPAQLLEEVAYKGAKFVIENDFKLAFEDAIKYIYKS